MPLLPERPNIEHLKKQAKDLLRDYEAGDAASFTRLRNSLPAAEGKTNSEIAALGLKLHDAQSCIAREYGLPSWRNLKNYVDWRNMMMSHAREDAVPRWLHYVYGHETDPPKPQLAARTLEERPDLGQGDLFLACASGDAAAIERAIAAGRECVNQLTDYWRCPGCKETLDMPPLVAVTHSTLLQLPAYKDSFRRCARLLLDAGADPNQFWMHGEHPLSALYGAAGKNHDSALTMMLLDAGANPNDGESLYHSLETPDHTCTRLLLERGAKLQVWTVLAHQLDRDDIEGLRLLLRYAGKSSTTDLEQCLFWAIRRRRDRAHVEALIAAGANPRAINKEGVSAWRLALQYGLTAAAEALEAAGGSESLSLEDRFVAACARCDELEARRILEAESGVFGRLSEFQLRQLPELVENRNTNAVKLMVRLGWPINVPGGDWKASALNLAVFQGDSDLTRFLLEHGASWTERHGFGDNVNGTLSWASRNRDPECGDWVGCARALVEHGMPADLESRYSDEVAEFFAAERAKSG
ncbi:MAG TPA: hypothetical protein VK789_08855 [Bryobacteraceae bacterium]|jgi:ankyrin repeat protein|nr:hypothetical protein [Bryobacteraceae bacterium]